MGQLRERERSTSGGLRSYITESKVVMMSQMVVLARNFEALLLADDNITLMHFLQARFMHITNPFWL